MRISDWSSDVCSSDLQIPAYTSDPCGIARCTQKWSLHLPDHPIPMPDSFAGSNAQKIVLPGKSWLPPAGLPAKAPRRSEEHTSELQSLMRISYAVFCLKKKKQTNR